MMIHQRVSHFPIYFVLSMSKRPRITDGSSNVPAPPSAAAQDNINGQQDGQTLGAGGLNIPAYEQHKPDTLPWTETRTVRHEWECYFSVNRIKKKITYTDKDNIFVARQNFPFSPSNSNLTVQPTTGTRDDVVTGLSQVVAYNGQADRFHFPRRWPDGTTQMSGYAEWTQWYKKLYNYWAPLESEWTMVVRWGDFRVGNDARMVTEDNSVIIAVWEDTYLQTNTSGIVPWSITDRGVAENTTTTAGTVGTVHVGPTHMKDFKNIKFYKLSGPKEAKSNYGDIACVIKGKWKNGQKGGVARNVSDIKQWYPTGAGSMDPL